MVSLTGQPDTGRRTRRSRSPQEFERRLNDLALSGDGWGSILTQIARQTGRQCRLIGVHGGVFNSTDGGSAAMAPIDVARVFAEDLPATASVVCADGFRGRAVEIRAGGRGLGVVLPGAAEPP